MHKYAGRTAQGYYIYIYIYIMLRNNIILHVC